MRIACLMIALLLAPWPALGQDQPTADNRPNIVFAFADDWGRYASAYREQDRPTINDHIDTPVFDMLAENGVLFWDAHVSAPSCSPSRTAVLTGRHFFRNGSGSQLHNPWAGDRNNDPVRQLESYHTLLQDAGYHTGVTYKTHVAEHLFIGRGHHYNQAGRQANTWSQQVMQGENDEARHAITQRLLNEVRGNMTRFLDDREEGQPFCWYFSPTNVHRAWIRGWGEAHWGLDPDELTGAMPAFMPDNEVIREDMADYLGECMAFDLQLGVIIHELSERGLLENTILVVSGDHGAPGFPRGKCNLYDFGTQVPLLVHWPAGIETPGRRIDNPTSLIDLAPTFLEAAGLEVHEQMNGNSLMPLLTDGDAQGLAEAGNDFVITGRERHVYNAREGDLPYPSRAIRTHRYLYIRNFAPDRWPMMTPPLSEGQGTHGDFDNGPTKLWFSENQGDPQFAEYVEFAWGLRPAVELYDLQADPDQMVNLADRPDYQQIATELNTELMRVLTENEDPRVVGDNAFDRPPYLLEGRRR